MVFLSFSSHIWAPPLSPAVKRKRTWPCGMQAPRRAASLADGGRWEPLDAERSGQRWRAGLPRSGAPRRGLMGAGTLPDSTAINNESEGNKTPEDWTCSAQRGQGPRWSGRLGRLGSRSHTAAAVQVPRSHGLGSRGHTEGWSQTTRRQGEHGRGNFLTAANALRALPVAGSVLSTLIQNK